MVNLNIDGNLSAKNIDKIEEKIDKNGYGEIAGGKNLANPDNFIYNKVISWKTGEIVDNNEYLISGYIKIKPNTVYTKTGFRGSGECFYYDKNKNPIDHISGIENQEHIFRTPENAEFVILSALKTSENLQLEEGETATSYEPYFPSNKMLAEENTQQSTEMMDIKMLGWSVPRKCPIQNYTDSNGVFHQIVGRVDLGSLNWDYNNTTGSYQFIVNVTNKNTSSISCFCNKYTTYYEWISFRDYSDKSIFFDYVLRIKDSSYTDATTFKNAMQGVYLYYELDTPITMTIDGNEIGETVSDVRKETTVNLFKPTPETTTKNGVTCTNNGDGTYTLNGTANANDTMFELYGFSYDFDYDSLLFIDCSHSFKTSDTDTGFQIKETTTWNYVVANDKNNYVAYINKGTFGGKNVVIRFVANNGDSFNNTIIKPMITTNLDATYDDFVPYTGNTGSLNGNVANIVSRLNNIYFEGTATFTKNYVPQNVIPIQSEGLYFITGTTNRSSTMVSAALWYAVKVPSGYGTIKIAETNYEYELSNTVMNYITVMAKSSTTPTESNPLIVNIKVIKLA